MTNPNTGATYANRHLADGDVELFARFRIISEVVEDGRYWRVNCYGVMDAPQKQTKRHRRST